MKHYRPTQSRSVVRKEEMKCQLAGKAETDVKVGQAEIIESARKNAHHRSAGANFGLAGELRGGRDPKRHLRLYLNRPDPIFFIGSLASENESGNGDE